MLFGEQKLCSLLLMKMETSKNNVIFRKDFVKCEIKARIK